jgi:hypothetical protein
VTQELEDRLKESRNDYSLIAAKNSEIQAELKAKFMEYSQREEKLRKHL